MTPEMIPAWVVALTMIYTGIIWLVSRGRKIRMDSRIFAMTFIIQALVYGILYQFFNIDVNIKEFFSRLMIIVLCLSQSLPLTISYLRSFENDRK